MSFENKGLHKQSDRNTKPQQGRWQEKKAEEHERDEEEQRKREREDGSEREGDKRRGNGRYWKKAGNNQRKFLDKPQRTAPVENVILQILAEEAVGKLMIMWLWGEEGRSEEPHASGPGPAEGEERARGGGHEGRRRGDWLIKGTGR